MLSYGIDRVLPFPIERLFDIAADVESYPRYFPNWKAARVVRRHPDGYETEQVLSYGPVRERFRSYTRVDRPVRIVVDSSSRTFRQFRVAWAFRDLAGAAGEDAPVRALPQAEPATHVRLEGRLEFRSGMLEKIMSVAISDSIRPFIDAFEREVRAQWANDRGGSSAGVTPATRLAGHPAHRAGPARGE
jgi:coenzyme Q-binding protein COQ10